ncbi:MAG: aminoacyl-tRNA hydrolase [Proteobacteria bacterium]|nr:aminoacyl-tRNA hydrolase [Pseudomonadota bacterium]
MKTKIELIVGLGNPGPEYENTRHNAGAWLVEAIAKHFNVTLRLEKKFHAHIGEMKHNDHICRLLIPTTFMNLSGKPIASVAHFYKLKPQSILVAHDDLDLPVGTIKLKVDGGHGGHNGLRDTIDHLQSPQFARARLGIGHPGHQSQVHDYVLHKPSISDAKKIHQAIDACIDQLPLILHGDMAKAMNHLHSTNQDR